MPASEKQRATDLPMNDRRFGYIWYRDHQDVMQTHIIRIDHYISHAAACENIKEMCRNGFVVFANELSTVFVAPGAIVSASIHRMSENERLASIGYVRKAASDGSEAER